MKTSTAGLALIEQEEGFAKVIGNLVFPYTDIVGKWTIGFGHLIKPGENFSQGLTRDQAVVILQQDVVEAEQIVNKEVTVPLNQGEFDALVDFVFNLGDRLHGSTLLRYLNEGNYDAAASHLTDWVNAGGRPNAGLKARRILEFQLWNKGDQG